MTLLEVTMVLVTAPLLLAAGEEEQFALSFTNTSHGVNREVTVDRYVDRLIVHYKYIIRTLSLSTFLQLILDTAAMADQGGQRYYSSGILYMG